MLETEDNYNVGLVIKKDKEKLHKIILDENFFKFLKKQITISQNRGDISGVIDIDKLQPCYKKYMENVKEFNESGAVVKNGSFEEAVATMIPTILVA